MKKISNQKGFALIETLVVATFVLTIFMLLIANYYPMMGKLERTSNYDETENIYIAYHTISLMKKNSKLLDKQLESLTNSDITTQNLPICTKNSSNKCIFIEFTASELCERFTTNKEQCTQFTNTTNINRVFITNYATKDLKEKLKNMNVSRALELYVPRPCLHVFHFHCHGGSGGGLDRHLHHPPEVQGILPARGQGYQIQGYPLPLGQLPLPGIPAGGSLYDDPDT